MNITPLMQLTAVGLKLRWRMLLFLLRCFRQRKRIKLLLQRKKHWTWHSCYYAVSHKWFYMMHLCEYMLLTAAKFSIVYVSIQLCFPCFWCSCPLRSGDERPWLYAVESSPFESSEVIFLELHASAMLCLPSGECMLPDATSCTALTSALYSTVSEDDVLHRQLKVWSFCSKIFCFQNKFV